MDSNPELSEIFFVVLLEPTNLGRLSANQTVATVEILPNQDPQGVLQLAPVDLLLAGGGLLLEEDIQFVNFEVMRSMGTFGEVTVQVQTTPGTATSAQGECYFHLMSSTLLAKSVSLLLVSTWYV